MSKSYQVQKSLIFPGLTIPASSTIELEITVGFDQDIAGSTTDLEIALDLPIANMKAFAIYANVAMTVETNDGTTPNDTFTLVANEGQGFIQGEGTNPVGTDITSIFVTVPGATAGKLQIVAGYDTTP